MPRARRLSSPPAVDLMPLIDVVFLLLTFFIFALVLTVRVRVTDIDLPDIVAGPDGQPEAVAVVALTSEGELLLNQEPVSFAQLPARLQALREDQPETRLLIALDEGARVGPQFRLFDLLQELGEDDLRILRQPSAAPSPGP